jgi:hypothetical protein
MADIVNCKKCGAPSKGTKAAAARTPPKPNPRKAPNAANETLRLAQGRLRTRPVAPSGAED